MEKGLYSELQVFNINNFFVEEYVNSLSLDAFSFLKTIFSEQK